eukprot:Nk52_evm1s576 gene=Nk52_evmTU1s576
MTSNMEDIEQVPGQIGTLSMDFQGNILNESGDFIGDKTCAATTLHMLKDAAKLLKNDPFRKLTLVFQHVEFCIVMDEKRECIHIVKRNIDANQQ